MWLARRCLGISCDPISISSGARKIRTFFASTPRADRTWSCHDFNERSVAASLQKRTRSMTTNNPQTQQLLRAAEKALFDATARLEEAASALGRSGQHTPPAALERARQWAAMIRAGVDKLDRGTVHPIAN